MSDDAAPASSCCDSAAECVFSRALLARQAACALVLRRSLGERELLDCRSPVARTNCGTLAALLHERARFALRLPPPGRPLMHVQALRLHCGGLVALHRVLAAAPAEATPDGPPDVHAMVGQVHERHGSLTELPWAELVAALAAWQPPRRRGAPR